MPVAIVDDERRYIDVNPPARLALGLSLAELQRLRVDDLTPPHLWPAMKANWARLIETGFVTGPSDVASSDRTSYLGVSFYAFANVLPGRHLVAFAPAGWPRFNVLGGPERPDSNPVPPLTPREVEVLALASCGLIGPMIAQELVLSTATVRTHFQNIYAKLGVRDRAAAVAKAMRLGLIP
jgi:DNA-binding CsgD family transcriptional regulator